MQYIELLKDLNGLSPRHRPGFGKRWPLKSPTDYELLHDYLQKVNYSIQDFNETIKNGFTQKRKDTVFLVALTNWIVEATEKIPECYHGEIMRSFVYAREPELVARKKYFKAVRSFVLAHPLGTDRHPEFGLDGDFLCVDLGSGGLAVRFLDKGFYRLTLDGLCPVSKIPESDVILSVYSKKDGATFFQHIGFNMEDLRNVAAAHIDYLYELDRHINRLKKSEFSV